MAELIHDDELMWEIDDKIREGVLFEDLKTARLLVRDGLGTRNVDEVTGFSVSQARAWPM